MAPDSVGEFALVVTGWLVSIVVLFVFGETLLGREGRDKAVKYILVGGLILLLLVGVYFFGNNLQSAMFG